MPRGRLNHVARSSQSLGVRCTSSGVFAYQARSVQVISRAEPVTDGRQGGPMGPAAS